MDEMMKAQQKLDDAVLALSKSNLPALEVVARVNAYNSARDAFRDAAMRHHATMPTEAA